MTIKTVVTEKMMHFQFYGFLYFMQYRDCSVIPLFEKWSMLGVRLSSYGCTQEVGEAREKRFDILSHFFYFAIYLRMKYNF